ncbi:MAG: hypothetical protein IT427_14570 [Pirellulales bacterium]|nr:hypothetical protein [Pirellulales bacterium]
MSIAQPLVLRTALAIAIVAASELGSMAQPPATGSKPDAAAKELILDSSRWREMQKEFHEWLSMQVVYSPQQVAEIKARLAAEIEKMSAAELQQFLDQWEAKLKVLLGQDATEGREWLGQFLSVAADGYRKQVFQRLGITNVWSMSAAQIEEAIQNIRSKELHLKQERAVFNQGRTEQMQSVERFRTDERSAMQRAGESKAGEFGSYQTPMSPKQYNWSPRAPLIPWGGWW